MIQLTMFRQADGNYTGFTCKGHAGYGDYGQDVVCAGTSALVLTIINSIDALTKDVVEASVEEETGEVHCDLKAPASKEAKLLLDALLLGCDSIRAEYGNEYITITFKEV